jgi:hypothetical protein
MPLVEIESSELGDVTVVNPDQITFLRQDTYGTAVHFSSGAHIVCSADMEQLIAQLNRQTPETLLIKGS